MKHRLSLLLVFVMTTLTSSLVAVERTVESTGMAPGDNPNAREMALADALREAVRQGAGQDIASQSRVTDFALDYDRVFASAFGYVKGYAVTESGMGTDGIYRVTVQATVGDTEPDRRDIVALQQMVRLKGAPRVALEVDELIEGVPAGSGYSEAWFEQAARDMQLHLVDVARVNRNDDRLAARDEFFGDAQQASLRRADFSQEADFIIQARVRGRYLGSKSFYGSKPRHGYANSIDLRALRPNGQVVAALSIPGRESFDTNLQDQSAAARALLQIALAGGNRGQYSGAWKLFRKIMAQWMTELDLGVVLRLEFAYISDVDFDKIQRALEDNCDVSAAWSREFDSQGLSFIDVESQLSTGDLKNAVLAALGPAWTLDRGTGDYLQFKPVAHRDSESEVSMLDRAATFPTVVDRGGLPDWAWVLLGAGGVLILGGVYLLGKKSKD